MNLHEVFRYQKDGRIRVYSLHAAANREELWVAAGRPGKLGDAKRRITFSRDEVDSFLEDVEQTLRRSGWTRCG
jgi:hypothetical protein